MITITFIAIANELGGSWSQIQWLVAAVSVGLGFGLQEIFANMVSGIINSKQVDNKIHDLDFVAYEMIVPSLKPSSQMKKLQEL